MKTARIQDAVWMGERRQEEPKNRPEEGFWLLWDSKTSQVRGWAHSAVSIEGRDCSSSENGMMRLRVQWSW